MLLRNVSLFEIRVCWTETITEGIVRVRWEFTTIGVILDCKRTLNLLSIGWARVLLSDGRRMRPGLHDSISCVILCHCEV